MDFEKIKITDIVPAEYNPRVMHTDEKNKLEKSINTYGLVDPIIINTKNNTIIGGHQRYDILLEKYTKDELYSELNIIRLGDIGWVFVEDDLKIDNPEKEKALNLMLNRNSGEWDIDKLGIVFQELKDLDFDLDLTGFNEYDEEVQFTGLLDKVEFTTNNSSIEDNNNTNTNIDDNNVYNESTTNDNEYIDEENIILEDDTEKGEYVQMTLALLMNRSEVIDLNIIRLQYYLILKKKWLKNMIN